MHLSFVVLGSVEIICATSMSCVMPENGAMKRLLWPCQNFQIATIAARPRKLDKNVAVKFDICLSHRICYERKLPGGARSNKLYSFATTHIFGEMLVGRVQHSEGLVGPLGDCQPAFSSQSYQCAVIYSWRGVCETRAHGA